MSGLVSKARHYAEVLPNMTAPDVLVSTGAVAKLITELADTLENVVSQRDHLAELAGIEPDLDAANDLMRDRSNT